MQPSNNYIAREALVSGLEQGAKATMDTATIAMDQLVKNSAQFEGLPASEILRIASLALDKTLRDTMGQWLEDSKSFVKKAYP